MMYPPILFMRFFPFTHSDEPINIISVLTGYICVLRYAAAVSGVPEHREARQRANKLEEMNKERAKQWGSTLTGSALSTCVFFELRVLYTMAVFHVVSKGLPDSAVEPIFNQASSKFLCQELRIVNGKDIKKKENAAYKKLYEFVWANVKD